MGQEGVDVRVVVHVTAGDQAVPGSIALQPILHLEVEVGLLVGLLVEVEVVGHLDVHPEAAATVGQVEDDHSLEGLGDVSDARGDELRKGHPDLLAPVREGRPLVNHRPGDGHLAQQLPVDRPGQGSRLLSRRRLPPPVGVVGPPAPVLGAQQRLEVHRLR